MKSALGFIELQNLCDAICALDTMLKSATVTLETWEKRLGGRLVTIIISGSVSSVTAAIESAEQSYDIRASLVIPVPHPETIKMVKKSIDKM